LKSRLSSSAQEWINHYSDAEFEEMRGSVTLAEIQDLMAQGLLEREAVWLLYCRAFMVEVTPDDPIYTENEGFNFSYHLAPGVMVPMEFQLPPEESAESEQPDPTGS
jgi:hypothetical protein